MTAKKTHGGKRKHAGRKAPEKPLKLRSVRLNDDEVSLLKMWGAGDMTAGIRGLIAKAAATWC